MITLLPGVLYLLSALGYVACAIIHPSPRFKAVWSSMALLFASLAALHFGMALRQQQLPAELPQEEARHG